MTLLAAFKVLLCRYTGQEDIVVGTPIAGRNRAEIEGLIGFFVNTLVLRTDLSSNPTFQELLGRVREVAMGAYAHQNLPFERLVEEINPDRELSRNPLFQVMFNSQNPTAQEIHVSNLSLSRVAVHSGKARFDLHLAFADGEPLTTTFTYNADLFNAATIASMAAQFETLLRTAVAQKDLKD